MFQKSEIQRGGLIFYGNRLQSSFIQEIHLVLEYSLAGTCLMVKVAK